MMLQLLLSCALAAVSVRADATSEEQITNLANSNTAFGFNLLNTIQMKEGGNVFLSPFSISTALAMTSLGADGDTETQMLEGLQIAAYKNAMDRFKHLNGEVFTSDNGGGYALRQANRLYGEKTISFKTPFTNDLKKYFGATLSKKDFSLDSTREDINNWVAEETEQKIKDLLQKGDLDMAIMVLINAIYFKAFWEEPFDAYKTSLMKFAISGSTEVNVNMMKNMKAFKIGAFPDLPAKILELRYMGGEVSMFVILPDDISGICGVQAGLNIENLNTAIAGMETKLVQLHLPKFEINDRLYLKDYLKQMGMKDMFNADTADFSKISDVHIHISKVIHQSFVRIDENGTEAAAATAVVGVFRSAPIEPDEKFIVDRPFLFFIRDNNSKSVLFVGRVVDPWDNSTLATGDKYMCEDIQPVAYKVVENPPDVAGSATTTFRLSAALIALLLSVINVIAYL